MSHVLDNKHWKQGTMSNAKLYSLSNALHEELGRRSQSTIDEYEQDYRESTNDKKADKLETACRHLKDTLSNDERKRLQIPDTQWTKWRRMFCWFVKTRI